MSHQSENYSLNELLAKLGLVEHECVILRNEERKGYDIFSTEIRKKIETINPDAIYVFHKQPLILFFNLIGTDNQVRESEIHEQVWSFNQAPVAFIIKNGEVQALNAFAYVKKHGRGSLVRIEHSFKFLEDKFSFWNLQSGETWKWLQKEHYEKHRQKKTQKRVNQRLFENIKNVRNILAGGEETTLTEDNANTLILRLIFIRYLIDRKVKIDEKFIPGDVEDVTKRRMNFSNLIADTKGLNALFRKLKDNFNGVLFKDKIKLTKNQANSLSQIFRGEKPEKETLFYDMDFYFEVFDFSIIPVEVISGIYESIINPETRDEQSAVYTPSFLVEYILNDTVDKFLAETYQCKIFDPAVGSGIFLAQSLRKMIERYKELTGTEDKKEFSEKIRDIAEQNLFGIDINPEALKVACFSIYITLLDYQAPKDIDKYKFPKLLKKNLFEANFFDTKHKFNKLIKNREVDFILGNPPWKNGSKDPIHVQYLEDEELLEIVHRYQLAQSFLLRTKDFAKNQPKCSLIVTSKAIYNPNALDFKKYFLEKFYLDECFDLSPVRRLIFEEADNPAMILSYRYAHGNDTLDNSTTHKSLKYNTYLKNFKLIVLEKNDIKKIKQSLLYHYSWMFKVALYGGYLDFKLIKKIFKNRLSIKETLKKKYSIEAGNGIKKGTPKNYFNQYIGMPNTKAKGIHQYYTDIEGKKKLKQEDVYLEAGRTMSLFKGEKILLPRRTRKETEICISYCEEDLVFWDCAYGIPFEKNQSDLYYTYALLVSDLFTYYQYLSCSDWGIYLPGISKDEYLSFPFEEISEIDRKHINHLVSNFLHDLKKTNRNNESRIEGFLNETNQIINHIYDLRTYEKDLIDYVKNIARYQFQSKGKQDKNINFTHLDEKHYRYRNRVLREYADVYIKEFEKIYHNEYIQVEIYPLNRFIAMNFVFYKDKPANYQKIVFPSEKTTEKEVLKCLANNLTISKITDTKDPTKNLYIQKDIKGFEDNSFYIIKPNEYKCWHRAMAWYDVAEFMKKIELAESSQLNPLANESV